MLPSLVYSAEMDAIAGEQWIPTNALLKPITGQLFDTANLPVFSVYWETLWLSNRELYEHRGVSYNSATLIVEPIRTAETCSDKFRHLTCRNSVLMCHKHSGKNGK
jgi:hypothetical protein